MDRVGLAGQQTGVLAAIPGMYGDGFAFHAGEIYTAQVPDSQHTVAVYTANYQTDGIHMGTNHHGFAVVLALQNDVGGSAIVIGNAVPQGSSLLFQYRIQQGIVTHGAGSVYQTAEAVQ